MGTAVSVVEQAGCGYPDLGEDLRGGGPGGNYLWVRYMGNDTAHWGGVGQIPPQSVPQSDGETNLERTGRWMVVSPAGGSDGGGRIIGGGDLRLLLLEHSHTVHFY